MSTVRVTLTLDQQLVDEVRGLVGAHGLSAFINEVVGQRLQQQRLLGLLAEMEAEHGPIDAATRERARGELASLGSRDGGR